MDEDIFMRRNRDIAELTISARPDTAEYIRSDGSIVVKLNEALYGTVQASRLW
jgi:hypothetical protein